MLQIYARKADRFCLREISNPAIEQAISPALWYDLLSLSDKEFSIINAVNCRIVLSIFYGLRNNLNTIYLSCILGKE